MGAGPRWLVVGLVGLVAVGCESRLVLGAGCTFTSECSEPLVCAGGRCRSECREDRDCSGASETCAPFGGTGGVCTPPASVLPCQLHSDCGPGARCERDGCRADCRSDIDCAGLGVCASGVCSEPLMTPPASDGGTPACPRGETRCGARCVAVATNPSHCGRCGNACALDEACEASACVPAVTPTLDADRCDAPYPIELVGATGHVVLRGEPLDWTDDPTSCLTGADGFFVLRPPGRVLVSVDSVGNEFFWLDEPCAVAGPRTCREERLREIPATGAVFIVDNATSVTLEVYHRALPDGAVALVRRLGAVDEIVRLDGSQTWPCGVGPSLALAIDSSTYREVTLTAEAPGVMLTWDVTMTRTMTGVGCSAATPDTAPFGPAPLSSGDLDVLVLVAPGATGPIDVHLTGIIN